jgi:uncharacterized protein YheU (UPF0270 family)
MISLFLLALAIPAGARADWSELPQPISPRGQSASSAQVAINQNGDAVFVWVAYDATTDCGGGPCLRINARARSATGALSYSQILSTGGQNAQFPQVAIDQSGNAVFTWERPDGTSDCFVGTACDRIQARARSAAGALSAVQTLSAAGQNASAPEVAVDLNGNAVFTWSRSDGANSRIQARARSAAGALSAVQTLSASGHDAGLPQVGVDPNGNSVFVWERFDGTAGCVGAPAGCVRIQGRARSAAGALSPVQTLSPFGQNARLSEVGVDQSGDAVFVWQLNDGTTDCGEYGCYRIQTRARSAAGALSAVQTLSAAGRIARLPEVGVDQSGDAVFVWERYDETTDCGGSSCLRIQTRARSAAGALSAVQTLSGVNVHASSPQLGVDQSGNAVFVWQRNPGLIQARTRSATGTLGTIETLVANDAGHPRIAVDPDGDAVVAAHWLDRSGVYGTYQRVLGIYGP